MIVCKIRYKDLIKDPGLIKGTSCDVIYLDMSPNDDMKDFHYNVITLLVPMVVHRKGKVMISTSPTFLNNTIEYVDYNELE